MLSLGAFLLREAVDALASQPCWMPQCLFFCLLVITICVFTVSLLPPLTCFLFIHYLFVLWKLQALSATDSIASKEQNQTKGIEKRQQRAKAGPWRGDGTLFWPGEEPSLTISQETVPLWDSQRALTGKWECWGEPVGRKEWGGGLGAREVGGARGGGGKGGGGAGVQRTWEGRKAGKLMRWRETD